MLIGEQIKRIRQGKGYTQEQLAEMVDITREQISQIETGKRYPSFTTLNDITLALECQILLLEIE